MHRTMLTNVIVKCVLPMVLVILVWRPLLNLTFAFSQGQDPRYDMGDGYEIWWPGYLVRLKPGTDSGFDRIIHPEEIQEFAIEEAWIIGKTARGWFAVNKSTHDVFYPYLEQEELQGVTGVDASSLDFTSDPSPYLIVYPRTLRNLSIVNRVCWVLVFALPLLIGVGPYAIKHLSERGVTKRNEKTA